MPNFEDPYDTRQVRGVDVCILEPFNIDLEIDCSESKFAKKLGLDTCHITSVILDYGNLAEKIGSENAEQVAYDIQEAIKARLQETKLPRKQQLEEEHDKPWIPMFDAAKPIVYLAYYAADEDEAYDAVKELNTIIKQVGQDFEDKAIALKNAVYKKVEDTVRMNLEPFIGKNMTSQDAGQIIQRILSGLETQRILPEKGK